MACLCIIEGGPFLCVRQWYARRACLLLDTNVENDTAHRGESTQLSARACRQSKEEIIEIVLYIHTINITIILLRSLYCNDSAPTAHTCTHTLLIGYCTVQNKNIKNEILQKFDHTYVLQYCVICTCCLVLYCFARANQPAALCNLQLVIWWFVICSCCLVLYCLSGTVLLCTCQPSPVKIVCSTENWTLIWLFHSHYRIRWILE